MRGCWVLEVDIESYFDTVDRGRLREFLHRRVRDGVLLRLIGKWLNAGVLESGSISYPGAGTPQGGVISPLLANIYLHYVLDEWFRDDVQPRLGGESFLIRYADDMVLGFARESDARRVQEVLHKRFAKYGLTLHPEKTRQIDFTRPRTPPSSGAGSSPGSFDLLGFTHYWGSSRRGNWVIKRKTAKGRFSRGLQAISAWCRRNRHLPISEQHQILSRKLRGHYGYFGITGNFIALARFRFEVGKRWHKWLTRRSQRALKPWDWYNRLLERFPLPRAICMHSMLRVANP